MKVCEQVEILLSSVILLCRSHYCGKTSAVLQTIRRDETVFFAAVRLKPSRLKDREGEAR